MGANKHPNDGNGELYKAKGITFLSMDQAGEIRIAGLWWGHALLTREQSLPTDCRLHLQDLHRAEAEL